MPPAVTTDDSATNMSQDASAVEGRRRDEALLATLGYKQELMRVFTPWELFGIGFSIIGLFPSIASVLIYAIPNGGASAMVWGWTVCVFFLMFVALALAELGSAAPTSGGLYYWTHSFSSPRYKNVLSWIVGYSNSVGNIASVASVDWGFAVQLMAAASIGSDFTFLPTTAQTYGVYALVLLIHATVCSVAVKYIARLQLAYTLLNVLLCIGIIIGLPSATPSEFCNSAGYAFGNFQNFYGWPNGFAFILSFLAPLWTVGGFDSSVRILGWAINVAISFNMGTDLESIVASPIGQPMAAILFNSFGKQATLAVWAIVVVVQFMMGMNMLTVCSRQIFAFSRDGGLPFSRSLRRVNTRTRTPIGAVWFAAFVSLLLGLLAFAGPQAIGAIFSLVVAGQYVAYAIPISARFLGTNDFKKGPFHLGVFTLPVAVVAVAWMSFILVIFFFPTTRAPTAASMNYTVVVWGGVIILSLLYFYFPKYGGRYWFTGPVRTLVDADASSVRQEDEVTKKYDSGDSKE
ncbi:amino acid transporter [Dentipellis sp. KUC8613]|nr:amino acid transporter [Dentipellis sp. KUC8613]